MAETATLNKPQFRLIGHSFRLALMLTAIFGLIALNVATVVNSTVHDVLFGAVSRIASIAGKEIAGRALASSPTARQVRAVDTATKDLRTKGEFQNAKLLKLDADHKQLQAKHSDLGKQHKASIEAKQVQVSKTKQMASNIKARLAKNVARNTGALTAEAIPGLGLAAAVAVTALDIYDACENLKEINGVVISAGGKPEDTNLVCGVRTPGVAEVLSAVSSGGEQAWASIRSEVSALSHTVRMPELRIPTPIEIAKGVCPVFKIPGYCLP
jgi:hypothetical protein